MAKAPYLWLAALLVIAAAAYGDEGNRAGRTRGAARVQITNARAAVPAPRETSQALIPTPPARPVRVESRIRSPGAAYAVLPRTLPAQVNRPSPTRQPAPGPGAAPFGCARTAPSSPAQYPPVSIWIGSTPAVPNYDATTCRPSPRYRRAPYYCPPRDRGTAYYYPYYPSYYRPSSYPHAVTRYDRQADALRDAYGAAPPTPAYVEPTPRRNDETPPPDPAGAGVGYSVEQRARAVANALAAGKSMFLKRNYPYAAAHFSLAVRLDPTVMEARKMRMVSWIATARFDEARRDLAEMLAHADAVDVREIQVLYADAGDLAAHQAALRRYAASVGGEDNAQTLLAYFLAATGKRAEAVAALHQLQDSQNAQRLSRLLGS